MTLDALAVPSRAVQADARPVDPSPTRTVRAHAVQQEFVALLDSFRDTVRAGPALPLTGQRLVDLDVCLALLSHLRAALPPEIVAAYTAQRDAQAVVARADAQARQRIRDAGPYVVDHHPVVRSARDRAERLQSVADHEAQALRAGADAYARTCLGAVSRRLTCVAKAVDRAEAALAVRDTQRR